MLIVVGSVYVLFVNNCIVLDAAQSSDSAGVARKREAGVCYNRYVMNL